MTWRRRDGISVINENAASKPRLNLEEKQSLAKWRLSERNNGVKAWRREENRLAKINHGNGEMAWRYAINVAA
jgi:hypothetical protein